MEVAFALAAGLFKTACLAGSAGLADFSDSGAVLFWGKTFSATVGTGFGFGSSFVLALALGFIGSCGSSSESSVTAGSGMQATGPGTGSYQKTTNSCLKTCKTSNSCTANWNDHFMTYTPSHTASQAARKQGFISRALSSYQPMSRT